VNINSYHNKPKRRFLSLYWKECMTWAILLHLHLYFYILIMLASYQNTGWPQFLDTKTGQGGMFIKSRTFKKNVSLHKNTELTIILHRTAQVLPTRIFFVSLHNSLTLKSHYLFNGQLSISINAPLPTVTRMTGTYNSSHWCKLDYRLWLTNI
jgi:hypothetical protein